MEHTKYWVWLSSFPNMTPDKITSLLEHFDTVEDIYNAGREAYERVYAIHESDIAALENKDLAAAEQIMERTELSGGRILCYDDADYPDSLRSLSSPPYVLYAKGIMMQWERILGIGVVGTRRFSEYGKVATERICHELAQAGVTIISGMARGIDSIAAVSALRAGNKTIAVLGCGIDVVYPPENKKLMDAIIENGVVLSEYPPTSQPVGQHFPARNRIISGLSRGVLATEAPAKSGALITADHAMQSGRDVFAVPGSIFARNCQGTNLLIQRGAKLVTSARDILEEYPYELSLLKQEDKPKPQRRVNPLPGERVVRHVPAAPVNNIKKVTVEDEKYKGLNAEERQVIGLLIESNLHIDDLARRSGLDMRKLNAMLPVLEMTGYIKKLPGNNYRLNI